MQTHPNEASAMKYNSLMVASRIARVCLSENLSYNNTKIQKLLYCCYGCALVELQGRICDEYPRAWKYGPVFPRVFKHIHQGKDLISINIDKIDTKTDELIIDVVKAFGVYTAQSLSEWSHSQYSPWDIVVNQTPIEEGGGLGNFIPDDLIADYFRRNIVQAPNGQI